MAASWGSVGPQNSRICFANLFYASVPTFLMICGVTVDFMNQICTFILLAKTDLRRDNFGRENRSQTEIWQIETTCISPQLIAQPEYPTRMGPVLTLARCTSHQSILPLLGKQTEIDRKWSQLENLRNRNNVYLSIRDYANRISGPEGPFSRLARCTSHR